MTVLVIGEKPCIAEHDVGLVVPPAEGDVIEDHVVLIVAAGELHAAGAGRRTRRMAAAVANAAREVANDGVATGEEQDRALGHPVALYDDAAAGSGLSGDGEVAGVRAHGALRMNDAADAEDAGARTGSLHAGTERAGAGVVEIGDFHHDATAAAERKLRRRLARRGKPRHCPEAAERLR